jgi:hypothetical protein
MRCLLMLLDNQLLLQRHLEGATTQDSAASSAHLKHNEDGRGIGDALAVLSAGSIPASATSYADSATATRLGRN